MGFISLLSHNRALQLTSLVLWKICVDSFKNKDKQNIFFAFLSSVTFFAKFFLEREKQNWAKEKKPHHRLDSQQMAVIWGGHISPPPFSFSLPILSPFRYDCCLVALARAQTMQECAQPRHITSDPRYRQQMLACVDAIGS